MICDLPKWWAFLTYDGFKYCVNVTEGLENLQMRGSELRRRRLGKALSIKPMINSRKIRTRLKHYALDMSRCLEILDGYGVGPQARRLLQTYWRRLTVVARAGGYYGTAF